MESGRRARPLGKKSSENNRDDNNIPWQNHRENNNFAWQNHRENNNFAWHNHFKPYSIRNEAEQGQVQHKFSMQIIHITKKFTVVTSSTEIRPENAKYNHKFDIIICAIHLHQITIILAQIISRNDAATSESSTKFNKSAHTAGKILKLTS
jgi:hypothetical protein